MIYKTFDLNLRHLRAMAWIVRLGSLTAAADHVGITQPALSAAVAELEARLRPLFVRGRKGMTPTDAGRVLAERVEEAYRHLAAGLRRGGTGPHGFSQPERHVTTSQLRALLALADNGSYSAAAQATGLSQPAVHRSVRDVERLAGAPLVERRGRGVLLTEAGRRAARALRLAESAIRSGLAELDALDDATAQDRLVVGAMPLCRARLLPTAMASLLDSYPNMHVTVIEGAHRELMDQLREGRIDLTVGALRTPPPGPDVLQTSIMIDRLAIVARAGHPLVGSERPPLSELARYRWLVGNAGSPLRENWEKLFAGTVAPAAPVDCGSVMVIRALLMSGDYLTLLSPEQIGMELRAGMLALVGEPLADHVRTIGLTVRADWRPTAAQRSFVRMLESVETAIHRN